MRPVARETAFASSVLPTPAGPSTSTGLPSRPARNDTSAAGLVGQVADLAEPFAGVLDAGELAAHPLRRILSPPCSLALAVKIPGLPGLGDQGPGDLDSLLTTTFVLMGVGFGSPCWAIMTRTRVLIAIGVLVVMVGSGVFVLAIGRYG